ncbi:MAG: hypothetical protein GEU93_01515 [Propionibacteriales bacterium]|nr:hypothetical protein [Propionibacteriales bacterium]
MARQVYFHIGAPKTGTTYLQNALWGNRAVLRTQGVLIPGRKHFDTFDATVVVREKPRRGRRADEIGNAWDRIVEEVHNWSGTAVISHEFFAEATAEQAKKAIAALAPAEVHIVFTARDYVRQVPAVWQEALKMHSKLTLSEFVEDALADRLTGPWSWRTFDIRAVLERWAAELPPGQVHVVTVPRPGTDPAVLWDRFARLCGIDPSSCDPSTDMANESLGLVEARLLQEVHPRLTVLSGLPERHRWTRGFFAHQVLVPREGERFGLRRSEAEALRARALDAVEQIRLRGYDVVGDLDELVAPDPLPELPHPDDVSDAELLDAAEDVIADLIMHVRKHIMQSEHRERRLRKVQRQLKELRERQSRTRRLLSRIRRMAAQVRRRIKQRRS